MSGKAHFLNFPAPLAKAGNLIWQFCRQDDFIAHFDL